MLKPLAWLNIGANSEVMKWVTHGAPILLREDPGHFVLPNRPLTPQKQLFVTYPPKTIVC
jgi:hypothetical protein